ncbi:gephyrin-like molybdotransferase Glp [Paenibacillus sp.]|uniref:molybdopterin molybdotransferase MoeA n=1 Tax=Paenibacillus sp. TaxID=58172 RepID=UPI002D42CD8F|nr:gephyrin-like molybdotransferase Glp [Paenibacillus sp.]HZG55950.1 gephyrin-like molybdotransferase Glp [Paenibacillus sp.]
MTASGEGPDRFRRRAVSVEEARRRVMDAVRSLPAERVPLLDALGRFAAEPVAAQEPQPHFRRSGVDGYAVRAADTAGATSAAPAALRVVGAVACGDVPRFAVKRGEAARIMTGAMVPEGADAVVMLEQADEAASAHLGGDAPIVKLRRGAAPGANVSAIGSDLAAGAVVAAPGERLGPARLAALAAVGRADIAVHRRPRLAIVPTGSELLPATAPLAPGKIRNSNAVLVASLACADGAFPVAYDPVPDEPGALARTLERAFETADVVATIGGASVGDYDVVGDYLLSTEVELLFNKVAMRPGSVTSAGVRGGKLLVALSGNPGACAVGAELLLRPALRALQGSAAPAPARSSAALAEPFEKTNAYPRYVRGRCWSENGRLWAAASPGDRSDRQEPGLGADCFVVIPPGGTGTPAGTIVDIVPLDWEGRGRA